MRLHHCQQLCQPSESLEEPLCTQSTQAFDARRTPSSHGSPLHRPLQHVHPCIILRRSSHHAAASVWASSMAAQSDDGRRSSEFRIGASLFRLTASHARGHALRTAINADPADSSQTPPAPPCAIASHYRYRAHDVPPPPPPIGPPQFNPTRAHRHRHPRRHSPLATHTRCTRSPHTHTHTRPRSRTHTHRHCNRHRHPPPPKCRRHRRSPTPPRHSPLATVTSHLRAALPIATHH